MLADFSNFRCSTGTKSSDGERILRDQGGSAAGKTSQVIENMVELVGLEPTTSSLRTMDSPAMQAFLFNRLLRSK